MRATQKERVDPGRGRQREDELALRVPLSEQRRERVPDHRLHVRAGKPPRLDHRDQRRRRVLVDLDGRVLILDRAEVRV